MSEKQRTSQAACELLYADAQRDEAAAGPSPDEVVAFLETARRLSPRQRRRLIAAVREALAEEARLDTH